MSFLQMYQIENKETYLFKHWHPVSLITLEMFLQLKLSPSVVNSAIIHKYL